MLYGRWSLYLCSPYSEGALGFKARALEFLDLEGTLEIIQLNTFHFVDMAIEAEKY